MRILVVEDEHKIANSIKKGLQQESYAVDVAYDGEYGFDLASTEEYDAIVLDLMLPKMDGVEICKQLRKQGIHTPILMLTAKVQLDDKVKGLNAGAEPNESDEAICRGRPGSTTGDGSSKLAGNTRRESAGINGGNRKS